MRLEDDKSPVLYSTMSSLAYNINCQYYKGLHYLWCTPFFRRDPKSFKITVTETSSPFDIYRQLENESMGGERHGYKIGTIRLGIKKGAEKMMERKVISESQKKEITRVAEIAEVPYFRPLMCIISRLEALPYATTPDEEEKAGLLSQEYILVDLPESAFDIITFDSLR